MGGCEVLFGDGGCRQGRDGVVAKIWNEGFAKMFLLHRCLDVHVINLPHLHTSPVMVHLPLRG